MAARKIHFGIGTKLSIAAAVGVVAFQWATQTSEPSLDSIRARPSTHVSSPLRKPEPDELLALDLSASQRKTIELINSRWQQDRSSLLKAMEEAAPAPQPGAGVEMLQANLRGYSELSRQYDRLRSAAWESAILVLTAEQRRKVTQ